MDNGERGALSDVIRVVFLIALCGILVFGGIFMAVGWFDGAVELIIRVSVIASLNVAVYGGAVLIYAIVSSAAEARERSEADSREKVLAPGVSSYFIPCTAIVFFAVIWGIAMFRFGEEMIKYVNDELQSGEPNASVVTFLLSALTGPFGVVSLFWLAFSRVSYDRRGVRVKKPLRREMSFLWYEVTSIRFRDQNRIVEFHFSNRPKTERRATVSTYLYDMEAWKSFLKTAYEAISAYGIEVIPERGGRRRHWHQE